MATKKVKRPHLAHLMRETTGKLVTTKCGVTGKPDEVPYTGWSSDVTCPACSL